MELMAMAWLRRRSMNQAEIPVTKTPESTHPDMTAWKNLWMATGESTTAQKSSMTLRICAGSNSMPTGCCIQALAMSIHRAEIDAPIAVSHVAAR